MSPTTPTPMRLIVFEGGPVDGHVTTAPDVFPVALRMPVRTGRAPLGEDAPAKPPLPKEAVYVRSGRVVLTGNGMAEVWVIE